MRLLSLVVVLTLSAASPALAQRFMFEQSFAVSAPVTLEASTTAGRIRVRNGPPGSVLVRGTVTVRTGIDVPLNAPDLAREIARTPPIERIGDRIRLTVPSDSAQRRAATVAYDVTVPPGTSILATTDSGEIAGSGLPGTATLRTQSGKITVATAGGPLTIATGSGAVTVRDAIAGVSIETSSSAIDVDGADGPVRLKTQSGAVSAAVNPSAELSVETGSSSISVSGAGIAVDVLTQSGAVRVAGQTLGPWSVRSESGRVELRVDRRSSMRIAITTRSGGITIPSSLVTSTVSKRHVEGRAGAGEHEVRVDTGSGAVRLQFGN